MKKVLVIYLLMLGVGGQGAPLEMRLGSSQVVEGEPFSIELVCSGSDCELKQVPEVDGAEYLGKSESSQTSISVVNGSFSKNSTITWTLRFVAKKLGKLTIPSIKAEVDGKIHGTRESQIFVVDGITKRPNNRARGQVQRPMQQNRRQIPQAENTMFMERDIRSPSIYVGQSVEANVRLYFDRRPNKLSLVAGEEVDFADIELHKEQLNDREVIDGVNYQVIELRQFITGKKVGDYTVPSFALQYAVPASGRGFFMPMMDRKVVKSNKNKLTILPLPSGASKNFIGAVGQFKLTGNLSGDKVNVGDTLTLTLTLEGVGDLRGVALPEPNLDKSLKVYADKPKESYKLDFEDGPISRVDYKFALVPSKPGDFSTTNYEIEVFDPKEKKYQTLKLGPLTFNASGAAINSQDIGATGLVKKNEVNATSAELLDIVREFEGAGASSNLDVLKLLPWFFYALGLMLYLSTLSRRFNLKRLLKPEFGRKKSKLLSGFNREVSSALDGKNNGQDKVLAVFAAFKGFLGGMVGVYGAALTSKDISESLNKLGASSEDIKNVERISELINALTYGGKAVAESEVKELADQLSGIAGRLLKGAR